MIKEIFVNSQKRYELIDITEEVEKIIEKSGVNEGIVLIFAPHSTAGILLTENENNLKKDWIEFFEKLVGGLSFYHNRIDDNADSHLLSGIIGQGRMLPIKDGKILKGVWQNIFLAEFDGPRERRVIIKIL